MEKKKKQFKCPNCGAEMREAIINDVLRDYYICDTCGGSFNIERKNKR